MSRIVRRPRLSMLVCAVVMAAAIYPMVRLIATAGDLDPAFGIGGMAMAPASGQFPAATAIAVQADGRIVAAGGGAFQLRVARFNSDGTIDTGFGAGGIVAADLGQDETPLEAVKILLRPDGRIVVVASFDGFFQPPKFALLQYHPDGTLDTDFGAGGITVHIPQGILVNTGDAAFQSDGSILVAGHAHLDFIDEHDFTVYRFTPAGALDTAFGAGGLVRTDMLDQEEGFAIAVQPDDRFIVGGFSNTRHASPFVVRQFAFVRYLPDGTRDPSFGTDGKVLVDPGLGQAEESWLNELLVQPDGRIVGAGFTEFRDQVSRLAVVRLLSDGQLDTSFADDGVAIFVDDALSRNAFRSGRAKTVLEANGRLVIGAGEAVAAISADGTLDTTFHGDGIADVPGSPTDLALQDDGKIVVGVWPLVFSHANVRLIRMIAENTPPALTPAAVTVQLGTSPRLTIGTATDASDPLGNLVVAPTAGTVPPGVTFTNVAVNTTSGAVSAVVAASCTAATGLFDVEFAITDGGNVTTFATVPVAIVANTGAVLSIADRTHVEGNFFATTALVVVSASGGVCEPVSVNYSTADGTATSLLDYTASSGVATIGIGQSFTTIAIPIVADGQGELDETFLVNLDSPVNAAIADAHAVVTIQNDDPPSIQFDSPNTVVVFEQNDPSPAHVVTLRLTRLTGLGSPSSVRVVAGGSAQAGTDFVMLSPEFVHFAIGQTEAEVRIAIVGDLVAEPWETVSVSIREPHNATLGTPSSVNIVIRNDDGGDVTAPIVDGFTNGDDEGWNNVDVTVRLAASDGTGSGVKSLSYILTGAQASPLVVVPPADFPAVTRASFPIVTEGITVVTFFAEDLDGNVAATQSLTVRLDKTAPALVVTSPQARSYALNEPVAAAYSCTDGGSGVDRCIAQVVTFPCSGSPLGFCIEAPEPGGALDTSWLGPRTFSAQARDLAGNSTTVQVTYTVTAEPVPPDVDRPVVTGSTSVAANAAGWHKEDVSVLLAASDGNGTGVKSIGYALSGAQTSALLSVPAASAAIPIVTEGTTVVTFFAEDVAGNVATTQSLTVRLDKTAPGVVITSPEAREYMLNEAAAAAYACTDGGSGAASCTGTTAVGAPIDTASAGNKTFTATATDAAGNVAAATVAYSVVVPPPAFTIRVLYDPLREHTRNSAIPIKLQVENAAGANVSSANLIVAALAVASGTEIGSAEEEVLDAGQANPLGRFRFVADGAYLFNLKTTSLKAGPYVLVVRVAGDSALHAVPFRVREP